MLSNETRRASRDDASDPHQIPTLSIHITFLFKKLIVARTEPILFDSAFKIFLCSAENGLLRERDSGSYGTCVCVCVCVCACVSSLGGASPSWYISKMSSQTTDVQKEQVQSKLLERQIARLEARLQQADNAHVESKTELKVTQDQLDEADVLNERQEETIEQLRLALDNADRPPRSDDSDVNKELREKNQLLEARIKDLTENAPDLTAIQNELSNVKDQLLDAKELEEYLEANLQALRREFEEVEAEIENHAGGINQDRREEIADAFVAIVTEDGASRNKLMNKLRVAKRKFKAFQEEPRPTPRVKRTRSSTSASIQPPVRQVEQPQPSTGAKTPPPARNHFFQELHNNKRQRTKSPPKPARKDQAAVEATRKVQEGPSQGFTEVARKNSASATQGPKQASTERALASKNTFAPLAGKDQQNAPRSSAETEFLRLKDRRTLHHLGPF